MPSFLSRREAKNRLFLSLFIRTKAGRQRLGRLHPCPLLLLPQLSSQPKAGSFGARGFPRRRRLCPPVGRARGRLPDQLFCNPTRPPRPSPGLKSLSGLRASKLAALSPGSAPPAAMAWNTNLRWRLPLTCLLLQVIMVLLFGVFVRYDPDADAHWIEERLGRNISSDMDNEFYYRYPSKSGRLASPPAACPSSPR